MITIKTEKEIANIRQAAAIVTLIHETLRTMIKPGVTGKMLDAVALKIIKAHGGKPSFLNYHGFPASICVSINEQLIHGIPNDIPFKSNDLVKIDAGASYNGYHADAAFTTVVGTPTPAQLKLMDVTETALAKAIAIIRPGIRIGDLGATIQTYVESQGFYLPTSYTGHGIGKLLHEEPAIPNVGIPNTGIRLHSGMTICIEPMVQTSTATTKVLKDKWTVVAADYLPAAHFEHTILVTENGCEVLTSSHKTNSKEEFNAKKQTISCQKK